MEMLEKLKDLFAQFRSTPYEVIYADIRRYRAAQLRELLSKPESIDLKTFNLEVWRFRASAQVRGQPSALGDVGDIGNELSPEQINVLRNALENNELDIVGNFMWGSGSKIYGAMLKVDDNEKLAYIQRALNILNDNSLPPLEKATNMTAVPGFGYNISTGLVMVYHPNEFGIYNTPSQEALKRLGYATHSLEAFEESLQSLKKLLNARDFIELDIFLYLVSKGYGGILPKQEVNLEQEPERTVWLFQASSKVYNLAQKVNLGDEANLQVYNLAQMVKRVNPGDESTWRVSRYRNELQIGDRVILWQGGDQSGIYALGEISSPPFEREASEGQQTEQNELDTTSTEYAVLYRYTHILKPPILRKTLLEHPILQNMQVIKAPQGTNFKVTPEEWEALEQLLSLEDQDPPLSPEEQETWKEQVVKVLEEEGSALHYREIAQRIQDSGCRLERKAPEQKVSRILNRNPDLFERVSSGIYRLRDGSPEVEPTPPLLEKPTPPYSPPDFPTILEHIQAKHFRISERTLRRYHLSLLSRKFVILSGVSGTGKTFLTEAYAEAVGAVHKLVAVAPNWTSNEDLLGYHNPISQVYQHTEVSHFLRAAAAEYEARGSGSRPYHLVLDEMNLARVEYYFAKFLSAMEVRSRYGKAHIELGADDSVSLTPNLFFIGTVNIDETTHAFADKVYDRAQLLELGVSRDDLALHLSGRPYAEVLLRVFDMLSSVAPFAFRVVDEVGVYISHAEALGVPWEEALDESLLQKVLPKLKGADPQIQGRLEAFIELASAQGFSLSLQKAQDMLERFTRYGFTSYF